MTNANECTCPSGDGSLAHPCPAHPAVEQAGGDERVIGWRERILAAHPNSDPGFWPDALLVEHMAAEIADLRAALAQPSPAPDLDPLNLAPHAEAFNEAPAEALKPEQAEAERPEAVGYLLAKGNGTLSILRAGPSDDPVMTVAQHERIVGALRFERQQMDRAFTAGINERDAANARLHEVATACATAEQERDAAMARVAGLELKLDQSDYAYDNDRCHMRGLAKQAAEAIQVFTGHDSSANLAHRYGEKWWEHLDELRDALLAFAKNAPVAQPEEMPGEILAAKLIETWVAKHGKPAPWSTAVEITAVATNMPNDERDRLLALDDDVDAQAQHSVPEGWRIERSAERIVVMNLNNGAGYAAARNGESGIAESVLYLLA
ncbi:TPA: hypothetical protein N2B48_005893, partial [Pseudomonas aeruginosa]|nr:hypothetical protein [Pseudomonas aeruginosa]